MRIVNIEIGDLCRAAGPSTSHGDSWLEPRSMARGRRLRRRGL